MSWREAIKKPVTKPTAPKPKFEKNDDDWETDITYQNEITEKSQRYGSNSVPGTGRIDHVDFRTIQDKVKTADSAVREVYQEKNPNRGYGGKYGTEKVMDKSAVDFSYQPQVEKHSSQTDFKKGFGGTNGIDTNAVDKSAVGYDYRASVEKHCSQTDFAKGFGGKFGVDSNAQDKSAVDYSHRESVPTHPSQKDYSIGFGGKYGVQKEEPSKLPVQKSPTSGYNIAEKSLPPLGSSEGVGNIRARFENIQKQQDEETLRRVTEERSKRTAVESQVRQQQPEPISPQTRTQTVRVIETLQEQTPIPVSPVPVPVETIYENITFQKENDVQSGNQPQYVGGVNVSSLLRNRNASSSSSKNNEENEDEWADDYNTNNYQSPLNQQHVTTTTTATYYSENSTNNKSAEGIRCIARYSYQKTEEDELGFEENEIITNVDKTHEEWWFGRIGQRSGLFPANYVEELP